MKIKLHVTQIESIAKNVDFCNICCFDLLTYLKITWYSVSSCWVFQKSVKSWLGNLRVQRFSRNKNV